MALLAPITRDAVSMYLRRFVLRPNKHNTTVCHQLYAPLVGFCEMDWTYTDKQQIIVITDGPLLEQLTSDYFDLIKLNAEGINHLIEWYPPKRPLASTDEARTITRAGVRASLMSRFTVK